jgi:uncharacterized protein
MGSRLQQHGAHPAFVHYRRMFWLLVIGALHGYLLWYGDILFSYALCGMIVYPARRLPPALLIVMGMGVLGIGSGISLLEGWSMRFWPPEQIESFRTDAWQPTADILQREIDGYRGSYRDQLFTRAPGTMFFQTFLFFTWTLWRAGGLMLLGMGLCRLGVFSAARSKTTYTALILAGGLVGVPIVAYGLLINERLGWPVDFSFFTGSQFNYWGSVLISLGYVGIIMLMCKAPAGDWLMRPFAAVGRMALSNYLMQTLMCTTIFYGFGLGLFGQVERSGQFLIVLSVWAVQLIISPVWLRHFRFGPAE